MTLNEFKAWLEGYAASFADGVPNADQWAEVQRRLEAVVVVHAAPVVWPSARALPYRLPTDAVRPADCWPPTWVSNTYGVVTSEAAKQAQAEMN